MAMGQMSAGMAGMDLPLNHSAFDLSDPLQAYDFLQLLMDDSILKYVGNQTAVTFYIGVVTVLVIAAILHWSRILTLRWRLKYASVNRDTPARPKSLWHRPIATITDIGRRATYPQRTPLAAARWVKMPSAGIFIVVITHLVFVIVLEFIGLDPAVFGDQYYEALSIKAGWLAIAQLPLLIFLSGKYSFIGLLTGVTYERLNVLHRWTARILLLLATMHLGAESIVWDRFGLTQLEWTTSYHPFTGLIAYLVLVWLNISTIAPLRKLSYEFFVIQHLLSFFGLFVALYIHLPLTALQSFVWIQFAINTWIIDRLIRSIRMLWNNVRGSRARIEQLEGGVTKVRVSNKAIKKWVPGSFVLLSLPKMSPGQSHPATIASIPSSHDGDLVFLLRNHRGFTGKLGRVAAEDSVRLLDAADGKGGKSRPAIIDGPYGAHDDFAAFDSIMLIAGSTGVTFTLPILLDIAARSTVNQLPLRQITFVWLVKGRECLDWITPELLSVLPKLRAAGIDLTMRICITDESDAAIATSFPSTIPPEGCNCDLKLGPCSCPVELSGESNRSNTSSPRSSNSEVDLEKKLPPIPEELAAQRLAAENVQITGGRCNVAQMLTDQAQRVEGEMGVAVCGPLGLCVDVRQHVSHLSPRLNRQQGVHQGRSTQGIHLHVEGFSF